MGESLRIVEIVGELFGLGMWEEVSFGAGIVVVVGDSGITGVGIGWEGGVVEGLGESLENESSREVGVREMVSIGVSVVVGLKGELGMA